MTGVAARERLRLEFTGLDGGGDELTWGQRFVWDILQSLAPANHYINVRLRVRLPTDTTGARVLDALRTLIQEQETLRTRFPLGEDGEPRQWCDGAGGLPVDLCRTDPAGVRRLADEEEDRLWREPFQHDHQWPVRVSVICVGDRPRQVVFVFSHLAVDAWAGGILRARFLDLLRAPDAGPAPRGWQPRARAAFERSAPGREANQRAVSYWRRILNAAPQTAFPAVPEPGGSPLFPGVGLHSVALAAVVRALAARWRVAPSAVLLAAVSAVIGIRTDTETVPLLLATGNRFTPLDAASVGTFYQAAPALVRLDAGSLAGTVRNAQRAATLAYLRGHGDPRDVGRLLAEANTRRGVSIDLASTVNVVGEPGAGAAPTTPAAAEIRELTAATRLSDLEGRDSEKLKFYLHAKSLRSRAVIELFCDSRYLGHATARRVLAGLELVLIETLDAGDLDFDRVAGLLGITPRATPEHSVLLDGCRVDVRAVRGLLAGMPGTVEAEVFVTDSRDGAARLVAYVVADRPTTPGQLHDAVIHRLDGSLTMAPHWYVVCRQAPARPESRADWDRQPVLSQGDGRAGGRSADTDPVPSIDAHLGA